MSSAIDVRHAVDDNNFFSASLKELCSIDPSAGKVKPDPSAWKSKLDWAVRLLSHGGKTGYLVRSNGDRVGVDAVRGKHVLICCVSLPVSAKSLEASYCQAMIDTHTNLSGDKFEMVLVAKMKSEFDYVNGETAFNSFFSEFKCLAVPFSDLETRDHLFSYIVHSASPYFSSVLVNPMGDRFPLGVEEKFLKYGSEWYPFAHIKVEHIKRQDHVFRIRLDSFYEKSHDIPDGAMGDPLLRKPLSLDKDILLCDPNLILHRFDPTGWPDQCLSVSELSNKYVGLYLCFDGKFMEQLHQVHQQCITNNQELEIVLVCVPFYDNADSYFKDLFKALKVCNIKSWFIFPHNSKVCRRLWRVFGQERKRDKLIILPPNCNSGELQGKKVISRLGVDKYPFTRSSILERRLAGLRSLTPASWFKGPRFHALEGKKLLIYLDGPQSLNKSTVCLQLMKHYPEIREKGWEVVFVPLDVNDVQPSCNDCLDMMPWPIMLLSDARKASVHEQVFFENESYAGGIIAVREDGMIVSRQADERLLIDGVSESLFDDVLHEELASQLALFGYP